jgi:hypothetical protein
VVLCAGPLQKHIHRQPKQNQKTGYSKQELDRGDSGVDHQAERHQESGEGRGQKTTTSGKGCWLIRRAAPLPPAHLERETSNGAWAKPSIPSSPPPPPLLKQTGTTELARRERDQLRLGRGGECPYTTQSNHLAVLRQGRHVTGIAAACAAACGRADTHARPRRHTQGRRTSVHALRAQERTANTHTQTCTCWGSTHTALTHTARNSRHSSTQHTHTHTYTHTQLTTTAPHVRRTTHHVWRAAAAARTTASS